MAEYKTNVLRVEGGNKNNKEKITELVKQVQANKIDFNTFVAETRKIGAKVTFGEFQIESERTEKITNLLEQFNTGKLNIESFIQKVREQGDKADFWNYEQTSNPKYEGNNKTRIGFKYNPYHHVKGKFMQGITKTAVKSAINFAHAYILKHYDREAFVYDDARLKKIDEYCKEFININFQNAYPYKKDFMDKIVNIILFFAKEDIFYTSRWLKMINGLPQGHKLTKEEEENIRKWN